MARERARLKTYLNALAAVKPAEYQQWPKADRLAFQSQNAAAGSLEYFRLVPAGFRALWGVYTELEQFFSRYAGALADTDDARKLLRTGRFRLAYLDYSWTLNARGS